jgi:hypothetical protein
MTMTKPAVRNTTGEFQRFYPLNKNSQEAWDQLALSYLNTREEYAVAQPGYIRREIKRVYQDGSVETVVVAILGLKSEEKFIS